MRTIRTVAAPRADAAPRRPLRVKFVDFIIVFLPSAGRAWRIFRKSVPARKFYDEIIESGP